jgi:Cu+-exporting ATPase
MAFSSVSVVTSSLTLRWWRRPMDSIMPGEVIHPAIGGSMSTPSGGLTPWTGMFMDSAASVLDSARIREIGSLFGVGRGRTDGYSQLPVEMV